MALRWALRRRAGASLLVQVIKLMAWMSLSSRVNAGCMR